MTTAAAAARRPNRAANIAVSVILLVLGVFVLVVEVVMDVLLDLTSADSPGDIEGATSLAFTLLLVGGAIWLIAAVVATVFLVLRRTAWWIALVGVLAPVACTIGGFLAVTSVVQ